MEAEQAYTVRAYSVQALARLWGVSVMTIYRRINDGSLRAFTVGSRGSGSAQRIMHTDAVEFIETHPSRDRQEGKKNEASDRKETTLETLSLRKTTQVL